MFGITVFFCLTLITGGYNVGDVVYNFGEDFNRTLLQCDNNSAWIPLEYSDLGVIGPYKHERGLRASENSCATTYPITLVSKTNLYIIVYLDVQDDESGLLVVITDENGKSLIKYMYNRTVKEYVAGWCRLSFSIEEDSVGYINLIGYSEKNEIILVDSIEYNLEIKNVLRKGNSEDEYIGYDTEIDNDENFIDGDDNNITNEENDDLTEENGNENDSENNGDSTDVEGEEDSEESSEEGNTTPISTELPIITNPPAEIVESASLGPWVITLMVVASATGLALVAIGAYHLGKNKGLAENPLVFDDIQEPRSAVSIPRVRGVAESPIQITDRPNFM